MSNVVSAAAEAGLLDYEAVTQLGDEELDRRLNGPPVFEKAPMRAEPDYEWIHRERHARA